MASSYFEQFGVSGKSLEERRNTIGGSDMNIIAGGDAAMINKLYDEKVTGEREDLTMVWPIIMGNVTEDANTEWTEYKQGIEIVDRQRIIRGVKHPFMRCTLDGAVRKYRNRAAVFDAKFTLGRPLRGEEWSDVIPRLIAKYTPQLHWNGYLLQEADGKKVDFGLLSILRAGNEPSFHEIKLDHAYTEHLIGLAQYFMGCIELGTPPEEIAAHEPPTPVEERVPVDMTETTHDPHWKEWAGIWAQTVGAADSCKKAEAELKKLVPKSASEAYGHGIRIRVAKNNAKKIEVIK
jgi:hypothetical protein